MISNPEDLRGLKITVMGLGLNGGGTAAANFLAKAGAKVTVTDLNDEKRLKLSIEALNGLPIRFVLGKHREQDFLEADITIKNPAVPKTSRYLGLCKRIETDISLFLRFARNPVYAITGSKGKSSTVSALHNILSQTEKGSFLGGNITVSPLSFLKEAIAAPQRPVVLEMSSWQLADLPRDLCFSPQISSITNIMKDHQNTYTSMEDYILDKELIFEGQNSSQASIFTLEDPYTERFAKKSPAGVYYVSSSPLPQGLQGAGLLDSKGLLQIEGKTFEFDADNPNLPGAHNRQNLLRAGLAAFLAGADIGDIENGIRTFGGVSHRLEKIAEIKGVDVYNDSASTIPDATAAALKSFDRKITLICGGNDKNIDFGALTGCASIPKCVVLLAGTASETIASYFKKAGTPVYGPYDDLEKAVDTALERCSPGEVALFSPGATSFGMFLHEFDRGDKFKAIIAKMAQKTCKRNA